MRNGRASAKPPLLDLHPLGAVSQSENGTQPTTSPKSTGNTQTTSHQSISKILTKRCTRRVVSKDLNHSQGR
jgi:hypothetical protein